MRETIGSLKAYFIFVSVLGLSANFHAITASPINLLSLIISSVGIAFSLAYLYVGIRLRKLLVEATELVSTLILASIGYSTFIFLLIAIFNFQSSLVVQFIIGLVIGWYLYISVQRLSRMEKSKIGRNRTL